MNFYLTNPRLSHRIPSLCVNLYKSMTSVKYNEKNFSTQQSEAKTGSRVSQANEHQKRKENNQSSPRERPETVECLSLNTSDLSFGRKLRLTSDGFTAVFADAKRVHSRNFLLLHRANQLAFARIGIIIAKKNIKKAAWRNRVRRIIRENFRCHQHALAGHDIVILVSKGTEKIDSKQLKAQVERKLWEISQ